MTVPIHDLVSVIIPTRNRKDYLKTAVESVQGQSWHNTEIIIVSDQSDDGTNELLYAMRDADKRVKPIINRQRVGGGKARNIGLAVATGKWVAFLDDDDWWDIQKIEKQLRIIQSGPNISAVSCSYIVHSAAGLAKMDVSTPVSYGQLLKDNILGGMSNCLCPTDLLRSAGGFDDRFPSGQDWDVWLKLHKAGDIVSCGEPLVHYRAHEGIRVTRDASIKYIGRRRYYFKYRKEMGASLQQYHLAWLFYFKARERGGRYSKRLGRMIIAVRLADTVRLKLAFAKNVICDLIADMF